jgi:alpha-methylacyl-CoA racemase
MTGWGQTGPLSQTAGHDINYVALTGALAAMGSPGQPPPPPLNLVGDYGGGALYLALGVLSALWEARQSGAGQVVDASIVDGTASLMTLFVSGRATGRTGDRGDNFLDGSAHYYRCYECADGAYIAIGAVEPHFYAALMDRLEIAADDLRSQDRSLWSANARKLEAIFRTRSRSEWCAHLEGLDVCFAPVLTLEEAADHPHMAARGVFTESGGLMQPAPAPRFSRTPGAIRRPPPAYGEGGVEMARLWGAPDELLDGLG